MVFPLIKSQSAFRTIKNLLLVVVMDKKFNKIFESNPNFLINLNKFTDGGQSIPGFRPYEEAIPVDKTTWQSEGTNNGHIGMWSVRDGQESF